MTKDEALDLALEALEKISRTQYHIETPPVESLEEQMRRIADKAITAIKQALALDKKADNARELGLDYEPSAKVRDFWEGYVPEPVKPAPVQPVAFEVGLVEWVGNKLMATPKTTTTTTAPAAWMEMVVANLVREGVGKHKARELAEHFYGLAQRPFVELTDEEISDAMPGGEWADLVKAAEQIVKEKFLYKRFIDGTPLANDIPCWMADFAQKYTTSPAAQRQWVGLTDEERDEILDIYITAEGRARAIEAKLRSKNT